MKTSQIIRYFIIACIFTVSLDALSQYSGGYADIAAYKNATASCFSSASYMPANATNRAAGYWTCHQSVPNELIVDLGGSYYINGYGMSLPISNELPRGYYIYVSSDNSNWTYLTAGTNTTSGTFTYNIGLTGPWRYVKLYIHTKDYYGSVDEFYVFGTSVPSTSTPSSITQSANPICNGFSTQLTAIGAEGTVYWYTGSCGGTQVATGNPISVSPVSNTTYFARNYNNSQFSAGCASVTITVNQPSFSGTPPTVASLQATGTGIKWYSASTGGAPLATTTVITNGSHYYASQTVNNCESTTRFNVVATVDPTPCAPTGTTTQTYSGGSTLTSLQATGSSIRWYSSASGGTALATSTVLVNGTHYFASQTISCTESATRFEVTVTLQ
jgi:hypothetical protein